LMVSISPRRTVLNQTDDFSPITTRPIRLALGAMKDDSLISGVEFSKVYNFKTK